MKGYIKMTESFLNTKIIELESKVDSILRTLNEIKESCVNKVYNTKELCEHLRVGKSVIDKLRQNGEIPIRLFLLIRSSSVPAKV